MVLLFDYSSSSFLSLASKLFRVDHSCFKPPLHTISQIIYTHTNSSHITFNRIQPHFFSLPLPLHPSKLISITIITASNFFFLTTYSNHFSLFSLIISTIDDTQCFFFHIHSSSHLLSSSI